jgi:hypothetical protein
MRNRHVIEIHDKGDIKEKYRGEDYLLIQIYNIAGMLVKESSLDDFEIVKSNLSMPYIGYSGISVLYMGVSDKVREVLPSNDNGLVIREVTWRLLNDDAWNRLQQEATV